MQIQHLCAMGGHESFAEYVILQALIVLSIEIVQFFNFTAAIAMMTMKDGHVHDTATRIRHQGRCLRHKRQVQESDDETENIGLSFTAETT